VTLRLAEGVDPGSVTWPDIGGATQTAVLSLCEPLTATLLAAVMLRQLPVPSQLLGAALLVTAAIAVQLVPTHPPRPESSPSG
jgi:threonine/homoserine efflux transporter RhtA